MTTIIDKLNLIAQTINEIENEDAGVGVILKEGFSLSINMLEELQKAGNVSNLDASAQLEIITNVLGVSLEDLVKHVISGMQDQGNDKVADQNTLDFITSDLDDYERFIAQNKSKEDLDFLSKEI